MSTRRFCDGDDCQIDDSEKLYWIPEDVASKLVDKYWLYSKYDNHFCKDCIDLFNEEDEQLVIKDDRYVGLGKDFKEENEQRHG